MELPTKFEPITHIKISKQTGKPLSKETIKRYKKYLNRLALAGYPTKQSLLSNQDDIVEFIDLLFDPDVPPQEKTKNYIEKRLYYSAMFYALDTIDNRYYTTLYQGFQEATIY